MIDAIDQKILAILQDAGRTSHAEIGRSLGMAASAIFERVKKLEEKGFIQGYAALVDPTAVDLGLLAFLAVRTEDPVGGDATARALAKRPEILEVHHVAGEDCYLVKVRVKDTAALSKLMKEVGAIKGVRATRTTVVLETTKEASRLPIPVSKQKKEKS
ncbi:MAG: Lrp/AsnC family transcriptional regulator [Acidobacteria bacterium]|nr:Lrp/AsnC family transcriptional regulator [Acidobacteriota bacterium]